MPPFTGHQSSTQTASSAARAVLAFLVPATCAVLIGCGTTISHSATEQLLASDAVDRSVNKINFEVLADQKVYLDTQYVQQVKGIGFVNSDYIVSTVRQQLVACGCLMQEDKDKADYVAELRVGAIGTDTMEITYGLPASNALSSAATLLSSSPAIPTIPEISFAKKNNYSSAAKVAVFAYHRETREPVWQSGVAQSRSLARDTWILGAGPFQKGTIYDKTQFAGSELQLPFVGDEPARTPTNYVHERLFKSPGRIRKEITDAREKEADTTSKEPVATQPDPVVEPKAAAAAPTDTNLQSAIAGGETTNPT